MPFCSPDKCQGSNQQRRRKCDSPPPADDGRTCPGHDTDTRPCGGLLCPGKSIIKSIQQINLLANNFYLFTSKRWLGRME